MVRFKNRYALLQLVWMDGRRDDAFSGSSCELRVYLERTCLRSRCSADEATLIQAIRESIILNFGDARMGSALASVQGGMLVR